MRNRNNFLSQPVRWLTEDEKRKLARRWISAFAKDVPKDELKEYVFPNREYSNSLYNAFDHGISCITGEAAWKAFDALEYDKALIFSGGYAPSAFEHECSPDVKLYDGYIIDKAAVIGKTTAYEIDCGTECDVYIIGRKFAWTYVKTHEGDYYFYKKN